MDNKLNSIESISKQLKNGKVSAVELLQENLKVIKTENERLNVFLSLDEERAEQVAKEVDQKIANSEDLPLIAGVPTSLKDNFNYIDTATTAGSKILQNYTSPYNATVTERLVKNNAVIMGKTNMDAFAHGSSTETSDFGPTLNPHDNSRLPGGSSGGAGAAVAAGMGVYAIGSETAGSVRGPAAWCGVYGFAPTYGRFSRYGVVAMGSSLDRPGILANSVADCAIVSDYLSGVDPRDATTIQEPSTKYFSNLEGKVFSSKKIRLGLPKQFTDDRIDSEVRKRTEEVVKQYEKMGAEIIEIDLLDPKYSIAVYTIVCRSEVSSNLARIDGIRYGHYSDKVAETVLDQIALNRGEGFGNEAKQRSMTGAFALSAGYYDAYYKKAQKVRGLIIEDFAKAFKTVDAIIGPTMPTVAPKLGVTEGNPLHGEMADVLTEPSALAGLPCISIPTGENSEGLPIGVQLFGPQHSEQLILDLAYSYEQNS